MSLKVETDTVLKVLGLFSCGKPLKTLLLTDEEAEVYNKLGKTITVTERVSSTLGNQTQD